ncbi:hypothetical protein EPN44_09300 [bacterium]|nr:MAG: hypothetical protein EPN44_09300 [bacterium]
MRFSTATALAHCWDDVIDARPDGTTVLDPGRPPLPIAGFWAVTRPALHLVDDQGRTLAAPSIQDLPPADGACLVRYRRVAESERRCVRGGLLLPAQRFEIGDVIFERPATLAGRDLGAAFQPEGLRLWRLGQRWDGLTRLGDRRPHPLGLSARRTRALAERLTIELRLAACGVPLRGLPRAGELLALLRRELGLGPST